RPRRRAPGRQPCRTHWPASRNLRRAGRDDPPGEPIRWCRTWCCLLLKSCRSLCCLTSPVVIAKEFAAKDLRKTYIARRELTSITPRSLVRRNSTLRTQRPPRIRLEFGAIVEFHEIK